MKKDFTVKNFKVFDEEGATFELAPITILTGCNSSGKSSMTKALLLLSKFVQKLKAEYIRTGECRPENLALGLPDPEMKLGNFSSILNCNATINKAITLSYSQYNYTVDYVFVGETPEVTGDGWLSEISIKTKQGTEVLHIKFKQQGQTFNVDRINIEVLKNDFFCLCAHQALDAINGFDFTSHPSSSSENYPDLSLLLINLQRTFYHLSHPELRFEDFTQQQYENIIEQLSQLGIHFEDIIKIPIIDLDGMKALSNDVIDMLKYRTLGFPSLFRQLDGIPKSETREVIMKIKRDFDETLKGKSDEEVARNEKQLSKLLENFEQSPEFETFLDYYLDKENNYQGYKCQDFNTNSLFNVFDKLYDNECLDPTFDELAQTLQESYRVGPYNRHGFFSTFKKYLSGWTKAILMPIELIDEHFHYVNSDRANIRRIYSDSPGDIFGQLLKRYLKAQQTFESKLLDKKEASDSFSFCKEVFSNNWTEKFGIGKELDIHTTSEGAGLVAKIKQCNPFDKGMLLADKGYGITQLTSVILEIQTAIYASHQSDNVIPTTIVIEEPEIHLHPKHQSLLAEMFLDAYRRANIHFIIETHSEYLIRRLQTLVAEHNAKGSEGLDRNEISMYYLYSPVLDDRPEGEPQIKKIDMYEDGRLKTAFGSGFMDEVDKIFNHLLQIKTQKR